jgi:hypothetical protein
MIDLRGLRGLSGLRKSLFGGQLPSTDLDERRHARGIHPETVSDEVIVGSQFAQTQSEAVRPRQVTELRWIHHSRVSESGLGALSTRY